MTISAQKLDKMIDIDKSCSDKRGLGYDDESSTSSTSKIIFVKASSIVHNESHKRKWCNFTRKSCKQKCDFT